MRIGFVDIHTHILPGVDDGSKEFKTSIHMLIDAYQAGTRAVFLTPHYQRGYGIYSVEEIKERFERFRCLASERIPISLYLGTEAFYELELPQKLMDRNVLTMNGTRNVLVEFFPNADYSYLSNGVFEIICCGYTPIIAHTERYRCLNRNKVTELANMGARIQINANGVLGKSGLRSKLFCDSLIQSGLADFIASDAHDIYIRHARLIQCEESIHKRYGKEMARKLFYRNAGFLLDPDTQ